MNILDFKEKDSFFFLNLSFITYEVNVKDEDCYFFFQKFFLSLC